jgi:phage FluMu gp28-like protein
MKLYPYQLDYYNSVANLDIILKSRKIGFTSGGIAPKAVRRCLGGKNEQGIVKNGIDQLLVSSSQRQSDELMKYVEIYIENILKPRGLKLIKDTSETKIFSNQKAIHCLPSSPNTIRSFTGDVRLDEFALHRDDERMFEAMFPTIVNSDEYQMSITSTPLGCLNMFYKIFTNQLSKYPDFLRTRIDCWQAIEMGCKMNIEMIKRNFDEESFKQEFECEFLDESTSHFPFDLLKSCIDEYGHKNGKSHMGIDIGRTNDKTAIAVTTEENDIYYLNGLETLSNKKFSIQKMTIKEMHQRYGIDKTKQDKGAIGYQLSEELEDELMNYEGVFTNNAVFMGAVVSFTKSLMEQGKFKFNENVGLMNAFHKVKKVVTKSNNITFVIERDKEGHGDEAVATMLALYNFKDNIQPGVFFG